MASYSRGAVPIAIMVVMTDGDGGHVVMGSRDIYDVSIDYRPGRGLAELLWIELQATCIDWDTVAMPAGWSFVTRAELPPPVLALEADDD